MKKIVASMGMVALSASTLNAAYTAGLSEMETKKPWSVGVTLRGFYDDNIEATSENEIDSFGFEINPWVGFNWAGDQTVATVGYSYSGKYYDEERPQQSDHWSHTHVLDGSLYHAFNPRNNLLVRDSFVIGQEPDLLRAGDSISGLQRVDGDNIRNYGSLLYNTQLTRQFGLGASYANAYWNYDEEGEIVNPDLSITPSWSGTLDRVEHMPQLEARWQFAPQTVGLLGYRYRDVDYTGDEIISGSIFGGVMSDDRNFRQHYGYAGVEHNFRPDLFGTLRGGVSYTDNYNDPNDTTGWGPYVSASLTWEYTADTTFSGGFSQDFSTTDVVGDDPNDYVRGVNNSVAYISFRHRLAPDLFISGQGTFQYSVFDGGGDVYDGEADMFLLGNISLEYWFNKHLSAHIGYNYDYLDSDVDNRSYDRNRAYIGLSATY